MSFVAQITADISNFDKNIKKATDIADSSTKKMQASFDRLGDSFVKVGAKASILSAGLVAVGTKAFLMAADIEDAVGATEQIFGNNADSVNAWASKLDTSFGIAKKEALEYSNLMGSMLINIGKLTEQEASKQAAKLIELAGDLTAMYGGSTQDAVRALTGALKGNNTMLDNYGMAVNEALIKQKALELGLMGTSGEMTLQAKQGATLALIWEQTGAAQGQAAREAEGASGAMRALKTEITNLTTELGEVLLPVITPIVSGIRDFVSGIRDLSPEAKKVIVVVAGITAAVGPLLLGLGSLLKMLPLIVAGFTALTGPIGIAVTAIVAGTTLIIANWDELKNASKNVVKYIKEDWDALKRGFDSDTNWFVNRWNQIRGLFSKPLSAQAGVGAGALGGLAEIPKIFSESELQIQNLNKEIDNLNKSLSETQNKAKQAVEPIKEFIDVSVPQIADTPIVLEPEIKIDSFEDGVEKIKDGVEEIKGTLAIKLGDVLSNVFGSISTAIVNGDNVINALGASLLGTLGGIMIDLGKMALGIGIGLEAIQKALLSLNPALAIGAGVALIALGSLFVAGSRKLSQSMGSGGGYSSSPSMQNSQPTLGNSDYRGAYQDDFRVEFKIGSNELVGVLDTANQRRNRLG